jgi:hypothetical protein
MNTFWIILVAGAALTLLCANCMRCLRDRRGE